MPQSPSEWNRQAFRNRWTNLAGSGAFVLLTAFFLWLGWSMRDEVDVVSWYIWVGFSGFLLALGLVTFVWYLRMVLWPHK